MTQTQDRTRPLVLMVAIALFIHTLDRGNFSTASPLIKDALGLTNTQIGVLMSAFFWTYVPGHLLSGWLIERIDAYRTLALGLAVWSLATFFTGLAGGFATLLVLRLLLGIGESTGFPATAKLLASNLPPERLAGANGMVGAGMMLGNAGGVLLGGLLMARFGWEVLFLLFGGLSLLWLLPWRAVMRSHAEARAEQVAAAGAPAPSYARLLARRETWGCMLGAFCSGYPYFLVLSWLPLFLVRQHGYSLAAMAWIGAAVYLLGAAINALGGPMADRAIQRGADPSRVRRIVVVGSVAAALVCMIACALGGPVVAVVSLVGFSVSIGLGPIGSYPVGQTLAGPAAAGKWMGLQNGASGMAGVISPLVTGTLIDATGDYRIAFLFAALVAALGVACWTLLIPRIAPLDWSK